MVDVAKMMKKALVMGRTEWERAAKILATDGSLPKIRSTRQQRRRRMRRTGMLGTAILISERDTMSTSNKLQPLVRKGRGQLAKQFRTSSAVKARVRNMSILAKEASWELPLLRATLSCASVMLMAKFCKYIL